PENREHSVASRNGWAAGSRLTFVARHGDIAEVHTARSLQQVPGSSGHVAKLGRSSGKNRLREDGIVALYSCVMRQIGIMDLRANLQSAIGLVFNLVEWQTIDVEQPRRRFDLQLHQVDQSRAACQKSHVRALLCCPCVPRKVNGFSSV